MVVHADQAGDDAVPVQIEDLRILRNTGRRSVGNGLDLSFGDHDRLVFARGRTGAVDDAHVGQSHRGRVHLHKAAHLRREDLGHKDGRASNQQEDGDDLFAHGSSFQNHRAGFYWRKPKSVPNVRD